jgi:PPOX class probable F420-dependent enzyme
MNRRQSIQLTGDEQRAFLDRAKTIILSTIEGNGYPHSVAMWYVVDGDGSVLMTTYAKSQKAVNIRRNAKVCLLVEEGETYQTLRGVLIRGRAQLIDDFDTRLAVLTRIHTKMSGAFPRGVEDALRQQASKRVVIRIVPERVSSWDHGKLGGGY